MNDIGMEYDDLADWIDQMVQESLDRGPQHQPPADDCIKCKSMFHGLPKEGCPGIFYDVEAIQNQGILDWTVL